MYVIIKIMGKYLFQYVFLIILAIGLIYSPVAYAGGVVNAIVNAVVEVIVPVLVVVAVVVAAVLIGAATGGAGLALLPAVFTSLAGTAIVGGAIVVGGLLAADCIPGSPIDPGIFCNGGNGGEAGGEAGGGGGGGGAAFSPLSVVSSTSASPTCTQITLSGIDPQGHNYAIARDGVIVKELTSADTSFSDTNLKPHTNYSYVIRIPYPAEAGFATSDSAPLNGYTKCLPQCSFGVDTSSIAEFGSTNLRWKCLNNDPLIDTGSCKILDTAKLLPQTVNSLSGTLSVFPKSTTVYTLTCANIDGQISIPQTVSILKPGIKEVKP